jgi:tetrahydromethanopterin S-methyltransferase subunit G
MSEQDPILVVVARLEGKLDAFVAQHRAILESLTRRVEDLERRVNSLWDWKSRWVGAAAILTGIGMILGLIIAAHQSGLF